MKKTLFYARQEWRPVVRQELGDECPILRQGALNLQRVFNTFTCLGPAQYTTELEGCAITDEESPLYEQWYDLVRQLLCQGVQQRMDRLLDWLSRIIQHPDQQPTPKDVSCLILTGDCDQSSSVFEHFVTHVLGRCGECLPACGSTTTTPSRAVGLNR